MSSSVDPNRLTPVKLLPWLWSFFAESEKPQVKGKEDFIERWEGSGFSERLAMVLHFQDEVSLTHCENLEAVNFLTPLLSQPDFDSVFRDLEIDVTTLILAVHDQSTPYSEAIRGRLRDHLESYLSYLVKETLNLLKDQETSFSKRILLLLRVLQTEKRPEDLDGITPQKAFEACYSILPERDKEGFREIYQREGSQCESSQLDFAISHADQSFILKHLVLPNLSGESEEMDLEIVKMLKEAQDTHQPSKCKVILEWICEYRKHLFSKFVTHEQARHTHLNLASQCPSVAGYSHIKTDPLAALATYGVEETLRELGVN